MCWLVFELGVFEEHYNWMLINIGSWLAHSPALKEQFGKILEKNDQSLVFHLDAEKKQNLSIQFDSIQILIK